MVSDFTIHEAEDIDLRITIADPNDEMGDISSASIGWVACQEKGGTPVIIKSTDDGSIDIEDPNLHIIRVHLDQTDTRNLVTTLWRETSITIGGKRTVTRFMNKNDGSFDVLQSDTDGVV